MRIPSDPLEARDHRQNDNEAAWLRRKIHCLLELEDLKGRKISLSDVFLGKHSLPTGLRNREEVVYCP